MPRLCTSLTCRRLRGPRQGAHARGTRARVSNPHCKRFEIESGALSVRRRISSMDRSLIQGRNWLSVAEHHFACVHGPASSGSLSCSMRRNALGRCDRGLSADRIRSRCPGHAVARTFGRRCAALATPTTMPAARSSSARSGASSLIGTDSTRRVLRSSIHQTLVRAVSTFALNYRSP